MMSLTATTAPSRAIRLFVVIVALLTTGALLAPAPSTSALLSVIVQERPGAGDRPERLIERLGGTIIRDLGIIGGYAAVIPSAELSLLESHPGVASVTPDGKVELHWDEFGDATTQSAGSSLLTEAATSTSSTSTSSDPAGTTWIHRLAPLATGAVAYWNAGYTGAGVDVAIIDSGVAPVAGLAYPGKVVNGADLSFESQADNLRYLDTYGHGTHLAGIIAGRDDTVTSVTQASGSDYLGMAPGARLLNVKVATSNGAADVSQVIAAIDWVVQHRHDNGLDVRVLNLAFGTNGNQGYRLDPLAYAVEQAWNAGIVVVVAAGNDGAGSDLRNPASDPFILAVGAIDSVGTSSTGDDVLAFFSSCGTKRRHVDLVAPGRSVVGLRVPGSAADLEHPEARIGDRFFLGSGTSQAAAVVSGAAALIIDQRPGATPDQVKALLMNTAFSVPGVDSLCQGSGIVSLWSALYASTPSSTQRGRAGTGTGTLEGARGSAHLVDSGVTLAGERDIFGAPWDAARWAGLSAAGASWSGGSWNGNLWSGASWSGASWSGASWSGASWSGASWSSKSWSSASWSGASWSGDDWSGASWSGASWSTDVWQGLSWR